MGSKTAGASHKRNDLIGQQVGFNGGDTKPLNPFNLVKCMQQFNKSFFGSTSEITNIDTSEHNLFASLLNHLLSLLHQIGYGAVAAPPPGKGDGTERAEVVTTILHLQEITSAVIGRDRRHEGTDTMSLGGDHLSFVFFVQIIEILHHIELLLSTQHQVDTFNLGDLLRLELCITTCHHNKCGRILLNCFSNGLSPLFICQLGY